MYLLSQPLFAKESIETDAKTMFHSVLVMDWPLTWMETISSKDHISKNVILSSNIPKKPS